MKAKKAARRGHRALAALGFDPNSVLAREPGVLLDPHFLGAMHAELEAELGAPEAATTLLQIGFIQGLQDASRLVNDASPGGFALPPPLAMRFQSSQPATLAGAIELRGSWPEGIEAGARLAVISAGSDSGANCHLSAGYTSGWLSGIMAVDILALETDCAVNGSPDCRFVAREAEAWRAAGDAAAVAQLADIPFDALREFVGASARAAEQLSAQPVKSEAGVVHIWDAVMVIPFGRGDEALRAVDLIGLDPAARKVTVIVLDLAHAVLDEGSDAILLEQILSAADAHGADILFAAVSPLSERVVAELDRQPLVIQKDLDQAIAMAFQIAAAQQNAV